MKEAREVDAQRSRVISLGILSERLGDEYASVVDERIDAPELLVGEIRRGFHSTILTNIAGGESRGAPAAMNFVADLFQRLFTTPDQENARAKHGEMQSHRTAKTGAAAGQENRAILQHVWLKHASPTQMESAALDFRSIGILVHSVRKEQGVLDKDTLLRGPTG